MKYQRKTKPALWLSVKGAKPIRKDERVRVKKTSDRDRVRRIYNKRVKEWLKGKLCECCLKQAYRLEEMLVGKENVSAVTVLCGHEIRNGSQVHHKHGRGWSGNLTLVESLWIPVCAECHMWIHRHPSAARKLGLYAPEGEWNEMPKNKGQKPPLKDF